MTQWSEQRAHNQGVAIFMGTNLFVSLVKSLTSRQYSCKSFSQSVYNQKWVDNDIGYRCCCLWSSLEESSVGDLIVCHRKMTKLTMNYHIMKLSTGVYHRFIFCVPFFRKTKGTLKLSWTQFLFHSSQYQWLFR